PHFSDSSSLLCRIRALYHPIIAMSNNSSAMPEDIFGENFVVPPHSVGKKIIDSLRNSFTGNGKMQRGDFYMDQTRVLLQQHFHIINVKEQDIIMDKYTETTQSRRRTETSNSIKRYFKAIEYKRRCKETYEIVVGASNRAIDDDNLMHQMAEALHDETSENLQSTHNNPLTDSHEVSSVLSGVAVSNLSSMDMETYQSEVTGDGAFVFELHMRDASTQYIAATFSPTVFSNNSADVDIHSMTTATESMIFGERRCR
ncbi:hypothetical protein DFH94DRAFT_786693, partial [Russula ochroleuca]